MQVFRAGSAVVPKWKGSSVTIEELRDAPDTDAGADSAAAEAIEADSEPAEDTTPSLQLQWTAPNANTVVEMGTAVKLSVWVTAEHLALGDLEVHFTSSLDGLLGKVVPTETGLTSLQATLATAGWHEIHAQVTDGAGHVAAATLVIGVCIYPGPEPFDAGTTPAGWSFYGDATHATEGWVELTGPKQGRQGAVFQVAEKLEPGNIHLGFSFRIGEGLGGGAHGLALTVFNVPSVYELEATLAMAAGGGCLGFGVSGECGPMMVEAIHVEIDTHSNTGNPNTDPTDSDHVAVLINGTMSPHIFWQPIPDINDGVWHTLEFILVGVHVTILLDGVTVIDGEAFQTFEFDGGFAGFSATTGLATDHHAVDDYWVKQNCAVP